MFRNQHGREWHFNSATAGGTSPWRGGERATAIVPEARIDMSTLPIRVVEGDVGREVAETEAERTVEAKPSKPVVPSVAGFHLIPFSKITLTEGSPYLVKDLIPTGGMVVIWGPPKCGKSFWTFDLSMHIALGKEYHGRRVQQGPVVYLALTRIMRDGEELEDDCGKKRAIHVANRCSIELQCASGLRHSRHERRYAASV
jgi:hypothetical protein